MSFQHFGKKQSALLVATVFYQEGKTLEKRYYDFVSEYLGHNNVFYGKCMTILLDELQNTLKQNISTLYNVTDGGSHFASRFAFWDLGQTSKSYGSFKHN
jgi:hypothetical protein